MKLFVPFVARPNWYRNNLLMKPVRNHKGIVIYAAPQAGKHKFPEEQRHKVYYLRLTLNSWRQKGNEIDPNWLNDSTQFINWVFLTFQEKGLTYEVGKFRFKRKDKKLAWSSQNIEIYEV